MLRKPHTIQEIFQISERLYHSKMGSQEHQNAADEYLDAAPDMEYWLKTVINILPWIKEAKTPDELREKIKNPNTRLLAFVEEITNANGKYAYLNKTPIVADAHRLIHEFYEKWPETKQKEEANEKAFSTGV